MGIIVPALIPKSFEDIQDKFSRLKNITQSVQIDVVDGFFASPASWPYDTKNCAGLRTIVSKEEYLPEVAHDFSIEIDLMAHNPETVVGLWIESGVSRIVIHFESTPRVGEVLKILEIQYGHAKGFAPNLLSVGIAIGIETDIAVLEPFIEHIDFIQCMGIARIGRQGEPFDPRVIRKVEMLKKRWPHMPVQVDGGVSLLNTPKLLTAGADRLIVGSAFWKDSPLEETMSAFNDLTERYGVF